MKLRLFFLICKVKALGWKFYDNTYPAQFDDYEDNNDYGTESMISNFINDENNDNRTVILRKYRNPSKTRWRIMIKQKRFLNCLIYWAWTHPIFDTIFTWIKITTCFLSNDVRFNVRKGWKLGKTYVLAEQSYITITAGPFRSAAPKSKYQQFILERDRREQKLQVGLDVVRLDVVKLQEHCL